ncbi:MAG: glycoside hydrolase 43 family protein [Kiritimatiellia bacterium]
MWNKRFAFGLTLLASGALLARDNGDGTYTNPIIDNDAPDSEILRVGDDFYYQQSTFHFFPGNTIYHSKDLVNWQPVAHAIPNYDLMGEADYDLPNNGCDNAYGRGSWAPTLKYHDGTYYSACYVWAKGKPWDAKQDTPLNGRFLVSRAKSIDGPWTMNAIDYKLYDPGLFFDDDGRVYVFHGQGKLYVTELDKDLTKVVAPARLVIDKEGFCEGSHGYKRNGYYYFYNTWGGQHVFRAKNIYGPYEHRELLFTDLAYQASWLHQGGLVATPDGDWYTIIFQDRGKYGREPFLFPVTWEDDWPVIHPCRTGRKPNIRVPAPAQSRAEWASDDFAGALKPVWQWNHKPDATGWSLQDRPGYLRLRPTQLAACWRFARNTLTQPPQDPDSGAIVRLDVSHLKEGDWTGLGLFSSEATFIGVTLENGRRVLKQVWEKSRWGGADKIVLGETPLGTATTIYLKAEIPEFSFEVRYSFSFDGVHYLSVGAPLGIPYNFFADWLGPRYGIFCYATKELGGYADVDSFAFIPSKRRDNRLSTREPLDVMNADEWNDMRLPDLFRAVNEDAPHLGLAEGAWGCGGELSGRVLGWKCAFRGKWLKWNRVTIKRDLREAQLVAKGTGRAIVRRASLEGPEIVSFDVRNRDEFEVVHQRLAVSPVAGEDVLVLELVPEPGADLRVRTLTFRR